nr:MAG TPA: hypothetical protein [Caudoviricetes sp.]DAU07748.1 MAG TPA: hypothetical protein [Caudoviricetes sp.]DAV41058.1 MAG TPA: hypothetical protein [Caudoviricetes sp.]DAZ04795.1 MAG TPA: hypothetical protein [Caudoviricetes sp.]
MRALISRRIQTGKKLVGRSCKLSLIRLVAEYD